MQHIDEHTLELFVLGSAGVTKRRQEIEAHIAECHGCRELAAQISTFYKEAGMEFEKHPKDLPVAENALVRSRNELKPVFEPINSPPIPYKPITAMQKFYYFTRMHPVMMSIGGVSLLGGLAMLLNVAVQSVGASPNPDSFFLNHNSGTLQILDRSKKLLWERAVDDLQLADGQTMRDFKEQVQLADLNGDGKSEIITSLLFLDDNQKSFLRVLRPDNTELFRRDLSHEFRYANRQYTTTLRAGKIIVSDFSSREKEIIVLAANIRSPSCIVRFDANGNETGRYWHFGHLQAIEWRDIDHDGHPEILAGASNDIDDATLGEFPCFVVLNPDKIVGQGKSTTCDQFQFAFSAAEIYYIRFPVPDIHQVLRKEPNKVEFGESDTRYLIVSSASTDHSVAGFHYVFDNEMHVIEVKSNNTIARAHSKLKEEGRISSKLDQQYLENLRKGVRYWDGKEWRKEVVRVKHSQAPVNK